MTNSVKTTDTTLVIHNDGYEPVGHHADSNFIWSNYKDMMVELKHTSFSEMNMRNILGPRFIDEEFMRYDDRAKRKLFDQTKCASYIINECKKKGMFLPENMKGSGMWLDSDGYPLINSKEILSNNPNFNGSRVQKNKIYELKNDLGVTKESPMADQKDFEKIYKTFENFSFSTDYQIDLAVGFVLLCQISGTVKFLANLLITAERGSGKSTFMFLVKQILGNLSEYADGGLASIAGIKQNIANNSKVAVIDEAEDDNAQKTQAMFKLIRSACSGSTDLKGTADQKGIKVEFKFNSIFACISPIILNPADSSRFIKITLKTLEMGKEMDPNLTDEKMNLELGKRTLMYMFNNFEKIMAIRQVIESELISKRFEPRFVAVYGPVLACAYVSRNVINNEEIILTGVKVDTEEKKKVIKYINKFELENEKQQSNTLKEHDECLNNILTNIIFEKEEEDKRILDHIYKFFNARSSLPAMRDINKKIGFLGLRLDWKDEKMFLYVHSRSNQLKKILKETKFANSDVKYLLPRIANSEVCKNPVMISGEQKCAGSVIKIEIDNVKYPYDLKDNEIRENMEEKKHEKKANFKEFMDEYSDGEADLANEF